jgi:hypothetical protein
MGTIDIPNAAIVPLIQRIAARSGTNACRGIFHGHGFCTSSYDYIDDMSK